MMLRTKDEQKAYLDGYEMCAECIENYLTDEGKQKLECLLMAVRNAVGIEALEQEPCDVVLNKITAELISVKEKWWYGVNNDCFMKLLDVLNIIDKYKTESEAAEQ